MKQTSLQRDLRKWLLIFVTIFGVIGTLVSFSVAYFHAKELQDDLLEQIATWLKAGNSIDTKSLQHDFDDEQIVIQPLVAKRPLQFPNQLQPGFDNIDIGEETWRIFVIQHRNEHYVIAQETDLREELALGSALTSALPILLISITLLIGLPIIINRLLHPIHILAQEVNQRNSSELAHLRTNNVPEEIAPFIDATNRLMERVEQSIKRQQRFIADAAHELRTPVAGLSILAENLENSNQTETSLLQSGLKRLQSLVEQLLNLARLQADKPVQENVVFANELLKEIVISLYPLAAKKKQDLGVIKNDSIQVINRDNHLWHIFQNSISNAIRFTPEGGAINITLSEEEKQLVFIVEDSGPGIEPEALKHIFEPFHHGRSHANESNGLGLAICQEIAKKNQGRLSLLNLDEGGIRFLYQQPLT